MFVLSQHLNFKAYKSVMVAGVKRMLLHILNVYKDTACLQDICQWHFKDYVKHNNIY